MNQTYQRPPTTWETVAEGNRWPLLKPGMDPETHNLLPGEVLECTIEGMSHFDSYYEKEYKGRSTSYVVLIHTVKQNQTLALKTFAFIINGIKRDQLLAKQYGIRDWLRIEYNGRDMKATGNPPHLFKIDGVKVEGSTFIPDPHPNGTKGQGLEQGNTQNSQYSGVQQEVKQELKQFSPPLVHKNRYQQQAPAAPKLGSKFNVRVKR